MKLILFLAFTFSALSYADIIVKRDIVYDRVNGEDLKLDLYVPSETPSKLLPVIFYTHGGCFSGGNKKDVSSSLKNLVNDGFIVASVEYRMAPKHVYPAGLIDSQQAVRFLRANAKQFGIDAQNIGSHGESAGGTLASLLGVHPLPDRSGNLDEFSAPVVAVSDWYGRMDLARQQPNSGPDCASTWLGMPKTPENIHHFRAASVTPFITPDSPEFFIIHGTRDPQVEPLHSVLLAKALRGAGVPYELYFSEGDAHGMKAKEAWPLTRAFFLRTLKKVSLPAPAEPAVSIPSTAELDKFLNFNQIFLYGTPPLPTIPMPTFYWDSILGKQLTYKIPVKNGAYRVRLTMDRNGLIDIGVNGVLAMPEYEIKNDSEEFGVIVRSGFIDLSVLSRYDRTSTEISSLEIIPAL